jgi:transcriptional regulator with XRE-family HTH domain
VDGQNRTSERFSCRAVSRREGRPATLSGVDDQRLGTAIRQVRIRRGLRQLDIARAAGVSQATISRIERGHLAPLSFDVVRSVGSVLDIRVEAVARWRAGDIDRMLNARHSALHELVARRFAGLPDWETRPEVSFAIYAERGVVDLLAFHAGRAMLLVIELKTDIADVNELLGTVDRKRRNGVEIARGLGWPAVRGDRVSVWIIVAEGATNRRRLAAHRSMLRAGFPVDGRHIGPWLRDPREPVRALSIWSDSHRQTARTSLHAVRRVATRQSGRSEASPRTARRSSASN